MIDRKKELPLIVASAGNDSLLDLYRASRRELEEALLVHGAILFRGFGIHTQQMLEHAVREIGGKALDYVDIGRRIEVSNTVPIIIKSLLFK